ELLLELRGAGVAEAPVRVPADLGADPVPAARALLELRLPLHRGGREGIVPGLPPEHVLRGPRGVGRPLETAAEETPRGAEETLGDPELAVLEAAPPPVTALVAEELELVARVV